MAISIAQVWDSFPFQIDPGQTVAIDSCPLSDFQHAEYIINFTNQTNVNTKSLNLSVKRADSDVEETVYSRLGSLAVNVTPLINGLNYELQVTNNEAFAIEGTLARALL